AFALTDNLSRKRGFCSDRHLGCKGLCSGNGPEGTGAGCPSVQRAACGPWRKIPQAFLLAGFSGAHFKNFAE
ncbi:MAG: hypothetical protein K2H21_06455, partial [Muribaculaceae bacterium]|nr:hypothetical protein [Muribaculaceae bacterium]